MTTTNEVSSTPNEVRTPTSDYPTIETRAEPAAIGLDEIDAASAEPPADANDYAAVTETELFADEPRTNRMVETSAVVTTPVVADQTPQPSESDIPDFRPRKRGRAAFAAIAASAAVIVVAVFGWSRFAGQGERPATRVPAPAAERAPERAPTPPSPAPAPERVAAATTAAPNPPAPALEGAVAAASLEKAPGTVTVTVKTVPPEAVIFRAGKRLGAGLVEVSVERNVKERLTALHDGYLPSNIVIDGSRESITVRLRRVPKPRAEPPPQDDSPYGDAPSADTTAASAPATTAAPAATAAFPSGTTPQQAPAPDAPSGETPAQ